MTAGHTDRATINQRRPLTPGMLDMLKTLARRTVQWGILSNAEKNQIRGLMDRGYVIQLDDVHRTWSITFEGLAVLPEDARPESAR